MKPNAQSLISTSICFIMVWICICLCAGGCVDEVNPLLQEYDTHNEMLEAMGINTDVGPKLGPDGRPVPNRYNPLGKQIATMAGRNEIFVAGLEDFADIGMTNSYGIIEDGYEDENYSLKYQGSDDSINGIDLFDNTQIDLGATSADIDGDGVQEAILIAWIGDSLYLRYLDYNGSSYDEETLKIVDDIGFESKYGLDYMTHLIHESEIGVDAGDIDNDSREEIVIGCATKVFVVDDLNGSFAILRTWEYPLNTHKDNPDQFLSQYIDVAVGEMNNDMKEDILVVDSQYVKGDFSDGGTFYYLYSGADYTTLTQGRVIQDDIVGFGNSTASADIGDVDGDRLNEILMGGAVYTDSNTTVLVMLEDHRYKYTRYDFPFDDEDSDEIVLLKLLDFDGDDQDEVFFDCQLLDYANGEVEKFFEFDSGDIYWADTGDVDDDGKEDLIWYDNTDLFVAGMTPLGVMAEKKKWNVGDHGDIAIAVGNFDIDSKVVKFKEHELLFTDPVIIAVLAAPPMSPDNGQGYDWGGTTYGNSTATEEEKEQTTGFNVGIIVGYEWETPLIGSAGGSSLEVEMGFAMDFTSTTTSEIETSIAYGAWGGEDKVIFTSVPFDVYHYEVLYAPDMDEEVVGDLISIDCPRPSQTLSVTKEYYNATNGRNPDIDENVLSHTIGDISSYNKPLDKRILTKSGGMGLESELVSVGQGGGYTAVTISKSTSQGHGTMQDISVQVTATTKSGGFVAGVTSGFHHSWGYSITNTQTTFYEGTVPDIAPGHYSPETMYQYGMFVHQKEFAGQKFVVVDYWVE